LRARLNTIGALQGRDREGATIATGSSYGRAVRAALHAAFFAASLHAALLVSDLKAATVSGTVELRESRIESVARGKDYSGVVVSLQAVGQTATPPAKHATMLQKNKMFTPHILPVVAGTAIDFPNADPIFHNAFSSYSGQIFDVGLYPPGTSRTVRFQRPGIVRVFCNIHPSMSAIILVLTTASFAVTPHDGSFHIEVPPGSYDLEVYHERATEQALQALSRRILVTSDGVRIPPIAVSEAGYLMAAHKNKYGKDYAPGAGDEMKYAGHGQ
jgi:plastocyanin